MIALSGCPDGGCGAGHDLAFALAGGALVIFLVILAAFGAVAAYRSHLTTRDAIERRRNRPTSTKET